MSGEWSDSLFSSDKGDSLGDGTWGKPDADDEPAVVDWAKIPDAPQATRKPRARLATPAPGSQKESGLLDITALADAMQAAAREERAAMPARKPAPTPVRNVGARLATEAKGSTGSGLIDVAEIVRQTEAQANAAESSAARPLDDPPAAAPSLSSSSLSGMDIDPGLDDDDIIVPGSGGRTMLYMMMAVLALAVVGLAAYVLQR
ncbi:MAG: hypothetical protein AB1Z98_03945 [Nannocystaceae bacterium]